MHAEVVLKRYRTPTPNSEDTPEIGEHGDGNNWNQSRHLFDVAVTILLKLRPKG
jgi:hypothetical protein